MKNGKYSQRKKSFWTGFIAALAAGAIATGIMLLLSVSFGGVSLPETFGSDLTALIPPPLFDYLHQTIGGDAKHYLFYGIIVGQCLVFALSGGLYNWLADRQQRVLQWFDGLLLALILWLFAGVILLPLSGAGIFGAYSAIGFSNGILSLAIVGIVFGSLFVPFQYWLTARISRQNAAPGSADSLDEQEDSPGALSRRTLLRNVAIATGIVLVGVVAWRFITGAANSSNVSVDQLLAHFKSKIVPPPAPNYGAIQPVQFLSPEVTSNDQFYLVSENLFSDLRVNGI